ncbi:hypothetical protein SADUNF_Sadunf05G0075700 [Salix dunnii]|uniref:Uncharacterized protein n=1 Tax=Salix dunnii TaxID=1413687 RepID=A0A835K301_9ROSI|nr:hypothetical protein SADUNF_Sadunf05G0075700 [Salix dunnii]
MKPREELNLHHKGDDGQGIGGGCGLVAVCNGMGCEVVVGRLGSDVKFCKMGSVTVFKVVLIETGHITEDTEAGFFKLELKRIMWRQRRQNDAESSYILNKHRNDSIGRTAHNYPKTFNELKITYHWNLVGQRCDKTTPSLGTTHPAKQEQMKATIAGKYHEASICTSTPGSICNGLSGLEDLYKHVDDWLNLKLSHEVLYNRQDEKSHDELLEESVTVLDVCSISRDTKLRLKEQVQALQSALRRRKGDSSIESSVANYICLRKKMKKDARKFINSLKQIDNKFGASPLLHQAHQLSAVIQVIREVHVKSCSIFQSLSLFLST